MYKGKIIRRSVKAPQQIQYDLKSLQQAVESVLKDLTAQLAVLYRQVGRVSRQSFNMFRNLSFEFSAEKQHHDRTNIFKAEQEIREQLANVAQVVAMGDMASNMVHNINNGVGSIKADLLYLKHRQALGELNQAELVELLDEMLENAESTLAMAENICKPFQALPQETVDVNACIKNVLRQKRDELSNIIILEEFGELPPIKATRQLEFVFENLLNNAFVAMKGQVRGVLKFATGCSHDGHWIEVVIQDSGPGLPHHLAADDIFKLGVSGRKDGLGYGLWWCDTFLKRWGGRIEVKNTQRGCQFLVRLPITTSEGYY